MSRADVPSEGALPRGLVPFRSLSDHRLAPGEPDIHGWPVVGPGGIPFGVVDELLVNPNTAEVVSLLVATVSSAGGGHAALPMARHRIDAARRRVLSDLDAGDLAGYTTAAYANAGQQASSAAPPVAAHPASAPAATSVPAGPGATMAAPPTAAPLAATGQSPYAGVSEGQPLPGEPLAGHPGVTVERTASGEEIIRVPVVEEELVVERRPVVKEVVVVRKRAVAEERVIEADLRRERVQVDRADVPPDMRDGVR